MAWHILEKLIEQVAQHSTLVGKFWTTFFFVLRFLIVVSIADDVFEDEQEEFVCNTMTPGCENVCFNEFSPISLLRLWALQVLGVAIPSVIFIVYTAHKMDKIGEAKKAKEKEEDRKKKLAESKKIQKYSRINVVKGEIKSVEDNKGKKETDDKKDNKEKDSGDDKPLIVATKLKDDNPPRLLLAYVFQVAFRLFLEIAFIIVQLRIYVFRFYIPELFQCSRWPCPNTVDCFVSRPMEKTVLLWVMFGTGVLMIALGVLELYHIGIKTMYKAWTKRHQDITKEYKVASNSAPQFGRRDGYNRYKGGYPQAVGIRVGYARSSISGGDGGIQMDEFI